MRLAINLWYPVLESRDLRTKPLGRLMHLMTPLNSLDARDDHLVGADRAIVEYRKWLARNAVEG